MGTASTSRQVLGQRIDFNVFFHVQGDARFLYKEWLYFICQTYLEFLQSAKPCANSVRSRKLDRP